MTIVLVSMWENCLRTLSLFG